MQNKRIKCPSCGGFFVMGHRDQCWWNYVCIDCGNKWKEKISG